MKQVLAQGHGITWGKGAEPRNACVEASQANPIVIDLRMPQEMAIKVERMNYAAGVARRAVLAERERCAKIAEEMAKQFRAIINSCSDSESWSWAMNDMEDSVNEDFGKALRLPELIAAKIRSGE